MSDPRRPRSGAGLRAVFLACLALAACESLTEIVARASYIAALNGTAVQPDSVETNGSGVYNSVLTSDTTLMTYHLSFGGLSSNAISAHIHGPARDTATAAILVDFGSLPAGGNGTLDLGTSGTASGTINLALAVTPSVSGDSLRHLLQLGLVYVDVHTVDHTSGEIRGQVVP